jgi:hypothetical protein
VPVYMHLFCRNDLHALDVSTAFVTPLPIPCRSCLTSSTSATGRSAPTPMLRCAGCSRVVNNSDAATAYLVAVSARGPRHVF